VWIGSERQNAEGRGVVSYVSSLCPVEFGTDRLRRRNQRRVSVVVVLSEGSWGEGLGVRKSEGQGDTWYDSELFLGSDLARRRQNESSVCDIGGGEGPVQRIRVSFLPLTFFVVILVNE
jgi:hypothetical protein